MSEPRYDLPEMTVDEYLAFDEASDVKHEYVDGRVYAMGGAHTRHGRIIANINGHLWTAARGGPCRTYSNDVKVRASKTRIYYPDVLALCTPRDDDGLIIDDPCLLVEVTSPSTSRTDHTEKLDAYKRIPALQTYLIVEQHRRMAHRWWRAPAGKWQRELLTNQGSIAVPCPAATLTLDEIYEGVTMPPPPKLRVREPEPAFEE